MLDEFLHFIFVLTFVKGIDSNEKWSFEHSLDRKPTGTYSQEWLAYQVF
jgi:hypothetical protein